MNLSPDETREFRRKVRVAAKGVGPGRRTEAQPLSPSMIEERRLADIELAKLEAGAPGKEMTA